MGKLRKWFREWFDAQVEKSWQRKANKMFAKHSVEYRDGERNSRKTKTKTRSRRMGK